MKNSICIFLIFVISFIYITGCASNGSTDKNSTVSKTTQNVESMPLMHRDYYFKTPAQVELTGFDKQIKTNIISFSGSLDSYILSSGETRWNHTYSYIWFDTLYDGRGGRIEAVEKYAKEHRNDALMISTVYEDGSLMPGMYHIILLTDEYTLDSRFLRDDMKGVPPKKRK